MKTLILCNDSMAFPAVQVAVVNGLLHTIVIPEKNRQLIADAKQVLAGSSVEIELVNKANFAEKISACISKNNIEVGLVMTFPYILPASVFNLPSKGFYNFHYGLLPQFRGSQPILRQLLSNSIYAGVTIHQVDAGIDTGKILKQEKVAIALTDTYAILQQKLAHAAALTFPKVIQLIQAQEPLLLLQNEQLACYYPKVTAADLTIQWKTMNSQTIIRMVNACNPWNKSALSTSSQLAIGITEVEDLGIDESNAAQAGEVLCCDESNFIVKTVDKHKLKVTIIYMPEGFFSGSKIARYGMRAGLFLN